MSSRADPASGQCGSAASPRAAMVEQRVEECRLVPSSVLDAEDAREPCSIAAIGAHVLRAGGAERGSEEHEDARVQPRVPRENPPGWP